MAAVSPVPPAAAAHPTSESAQESRRLTHAGPTSTENFTPSTTMLAESPVDTAGRDATGCPTPSPSAPSPQTQPVPTQPAQSGPRDAGHPGQREGSESRRSFKPPSCLPPRPLPHRASPVPLSAEPLIPGRPLGVLDRPLNLGPLLLQPQRLGVRRDCIIEWIHLPSPSENKAALRKTRAAELVDAASTFLHQLLQPCPHAAVEVLDGVAVILRAQRNESGPNAVEITFEVVP